MDLALDSDGDLLIEDDELKLVSGNEALAQHLKIRFQFFLGEWFLDTRIGIPYFQDILVKNPNMLFVRSVFRSTILNTPGIADLNSFEMAFDTTLRSLTVTFSARKTDGEVLDFSEEFIVT